LAKQDRRTVSDADRLAARHRPKGQPVMHQNWGKLLFMHWRVDPTTIRPHVPSHLEIDTYGESAWMAITPFTMWDIRFFPPFVPAVPGLSSMHELNVRTYVHHDGIPGVWFFSLDASSAAAVLAARTIFYLPYYNADIDIKIHGEQIDYSLRRSDHPTAELDATWTIGEKLPQAQPGSKEFFLTERYVLYSENEGSLYRARIYHEPWELNAAELKSFDSNIVEADGLTKPKGQPLVHYAEEVSVDIWYLERVED
jgi:uncharacterized protein YqjF (DUF2071 family)